MQNSILKDLKILLNYLGEEYLNGSEIFYTKNQLHFLLGWELSSEDFKVITEDMGYTVQDGNQIIIYCETKV